MLFGYGRHVRIGDRYWVGLGETMIRLRLTRDGRVFLAFWAAYIASLILLAAAILWRWPPW